MSCRRLCYLRAEPRRNLRGKDELCVYMHWRYDVTLTPCSFLLIQVHFDHGCSDWPVPNEDIRKVPNSPGDSQIGLCRLPPWKSLLLHLNETLRCCAYLRLA